MSSDTIISSLSPESLQSGFAELGYICDESIAMSVYLATQLNTPLLVEVPPGVGKTELAKATATLLQQSLIRIQCYDGLDETKDL